MKLNLNILQYLLQYFFKIFDVTHKKPCQFGKAFYDLFL